MVPLYYDGRILYHDFPSERKVDQPVTEPPPHISQRSNGSLVRWPTENVLQISD